MNKELIERFGAMSDEELVDVLARESDYLPEAINHAKEELKRRNIPQPDFERLLEKSRAVRQFEIEKANEGLTIREKLICILLSLQVFIPVAIPFIKLFYHNRPRMIRYRTMGYFRKSSQVLSYTFAGIFFWFFILVIFFYLPVKNNLK